MGGAFSDASLAERSPARKRKFYAFVPTNPNRVVGNKTPFQVLCRQSPVQEQSMHQEHHDFPIEQLFALLAIGLIAAVACGLI